MREIVLVGVAVALVVAAPVALAAPTYAEAQEFAEQISDRGILTNRYQSEIEQILASICYQAVGNGNYSVSPSYIASMYADSYNLSQDDADWLVGTALDYCS